MNDTRTTGTIEADRTVPNIRVTLVGATTTPDRWHPGARGSRRYVAAGSIAGLADGAES